jgi:hypothetical protein
MSGQAQAATRNAPRALPVFANTTSPTAFLPKLPHVRYNLTKASGPFFAKVFANITLCQGFTRRY